MLGIVLVSEGMTREFTLHIYHFKAISSEL